MTMIRSLRFLGVRTAAFEPMVALYRDILGRLRPRRAGRRLVPRSRRRVDPCVRRERRGPRVLRGGPVVGLEVEDFDAARRRWSPAGIAFVGEPQRDGRVAWNHFTGPDGNVYEIIGPDRAGRDDRRGGSCCAPLG